MSKPLDIFVTISQVDKKNITFLSELSEDDRKGFFPVVVQRWLSGITDENVILKLNDNSNPYVFSLHKHPNLLYQLFCTTSSGKVRRRNWLKQEGKKHNYPITIQLLSEYLECSTRQAKLQEPLLSNEQILELAEYLGYQKDQVSKLKAEIKGR